MKRSREELNNPSMDNPSKYRMVAPKGSESMPDGGASAATMQAVGQSGEQMPVDNFGSQMHAKMQQYPSLPQPFSQHPGGVPFQRLPPTTGHYPGSVGQQPNPGPSMLQQGQMQASHPHQVQQMAHQPIDASVRGIQQAPTGPAPGGPVGQVKFETALEFLDKVKTQFHSQPDVYKRFLKIMKDFKSQDIDTPGVIQRVSTLFKGHNHLIMGFNHFLPEGYKIDAADIQALNGDGPVLMAPTAPVADAPAEAATRKQPELDHARNYVKKIKMRFENQPDIYKAFLRILHTYHEEHHTIKDVYEQVATLFRNHTDLLGEFKDFLPDNSAPASQTRRGRSKASKNKRKSRTLEHPQTQVDVADYNFFVRVKTQLRNERLYREFLKCVSLYNSGILSDSDLQLMVQDLLDDYPGLYEEFREYCNCEPGKETYETVEYATRSALTTVISKNEIDFSNCKRLGPSYRALPEEYVQPACSGRSEASQAVLNDIWVSMPTGTEDGGTFKTSRKNQYEDILFKCEDDRYELDMVIELNSSTIRILVPIIKRMIACTPEELAEFELDPSELGALHVKSIERIYGDKGKEIIQYIFQNPVVAVPCVLRRLRQKDEEWREARREWSKVWREVNEKNYYKSLDHQSLYFKQKDKKALSTRELVAEIKKEKFNERTAEPSSKKGHHLRYEMPDSSLLSTVRDIVLFHAQKTLSASESDKLDCFMSVFVNGCLTGSWQNGEEEKDGENVEMGEADGEEKKEKSVFFGSTPFYVFFRLYQVLYERIGSLKKMAQVVIKEREVAARNQFSSRKQPKSRFASVDDIFDHFLSNLLKPLITGDLDSEMYEDECRELFGIDSFVVFTMEKLIHHIVKQLHNMLSDDLCSDLVALHSYETARSNQTTEPVYRANVAKLLDEERCFRFVFSKSSKEGCIIYMRLEDTLREQELLATRKVEYQQYVDGFLTSEPIGDLPKERRVFLKRNRKKLAKDPKCLENAEVVNQLECKMCLRSFRIFYVEQTEDAFYRPGSLLKAKADVNAAARKAKFAAWNEKRLAEMGSS